jgi:hypothetical protein
MATNNKPATTLRRGIVKAAIWENMSKNGPFFSTTLSRSVQGSLRQLAQRDFIQS